MNSGNDIESAIRQLKRGLLNQEPALADKAMVALVNCGDRARQAVERELARIDLKKVENRREISLVSGLAELLHDIDEAASEKYLTQAMQSELLPALRSAFSSIQRFSRTNYRETEHNDILLLEEKRLDRRYSAAQHVKQWLSTVPPTDLNDISRIYIICDEQEYDFAGTYSPHVACIALVWNGSFHPYVPLNWLARLDSRRTLYHEIGHHKYKHTYGQVPEQEHEANRYAAEQLRTAVPLLRILVNSLRFLFRLISKPKLFWVILNCKENSKKFFISMEVAAYSEKEAITLSIKHMKNVGVSYARLDEIEDVESDDVRPGKAGVLQVMDRSYY